MAKRVIPKAGIDTIVNIQTGFAKGIGAAATAVAMSVAMQDKKVVGKGAVAKEESKISKGPKIIVKDK